MKFVISGYYGFKNTGDEAILDVIIEQIQKADPQAEIIIPSPSAGNRSLMAIPRYNLFSLVKAIKKADVLISGGGGLLQDSTGLFTVPYYLGIIYIAKFLKKKVVFLGQGYGPVKNIINKWLIKKILNRVDLITLRDEVSLKEMRRIGVVKPPMLLTSDPAFLLNKESPLNILKENHLLIENKKAIGISVRSSKNTTDLFRKNLAGSLDTIIEKYNVQIIFIPLHFPYDLRESFKILEKMKNKAVILTEQHPPKEMLGLISSMDLFIGMRLHSLIFCAVSGIPMIGINYDPKVKALLDEYSSPCMPDNFCIKELTDTFDNIWADQESISKQIIDHTEIMKSKAQLNFSALFEYTSLPRQTEFFGVKIDLYDLNSSLTKAEEFIKSGKPHLITTPNPEIIVASQKDEELKNILNSSDLRLPDGSGLILIAKILNLPLRHRITGIDFMIKMFELSKAKGYRVFLLGSSPEIVMRAEQKLISDGINIVGAHDGYFNESQDSQIIELIKAAKPDILFVGLGAPRQEKWISKYYKEMGVPFNMVIGGSLDVISGKKQRAPQFTQTLGIEWLWRLFKEPYRWRRQLALVKFTLMAIKKRFLAT